MVSRPTWHLCQLRSRLFSSHDLGFRILPHRNPGYASNHELEYTHVWGNYDIFRLLLIFRWEKDLC